jgi:hypothetical protein
LKIPESGIAVNESPGVDPETATFTPVVEGKFKYYCGNRFLFVKCREENE